MVGRQGSGAASAAPLAAAAATPSAAGAAAPPAPRGRFPRSHRDLGPWPTLLPPQPRTPFPPRGRRCKRARHLDRHPHSRDGGASYRRGIGRDGSVSDNHGRSQGARRRLSAAPQGAGQ